MKKNFQSHKFLLMVPYSYPDYSGSGRNAFNFGKYLARKNVPVKLVTFNRNRKYEKYERISGLLIDRITYFNRNTFLKIISLLIWIIPGYITRIIQSDIIYIFGKYLIAWQFVILFSKLCRKKILFRSLIYGEDDAGTILWQGTRIQRYFNKFLLRKINCYYSIHPGFSLEYRKATGKDNGIIEIPQGVDTDYFHTVNLEEKKNIRERLGLNETGFIIISVAFLISRKGFGEIFSCLSRLDIPFQYLIVGEYYFSKDHFMSRSEVESSRLVESGRNLLGSRLFLTGPKENINEYIQASDLCLFNSKAEGLPNSMLEAMACGLPVVTNPIAGLEGYLLLHKKNSMIFKKTDELKPQLEELYHNHELKNSLGNNARETILKMASFDIVLHNIQKGLKIDY